MWSSQARTSHFMSITSWSVGQMTLHTLLALSVLPLMQEEVSSSAILPSTPFQHNSPSITMDRPIVRVKEHFSLVYIIHSEGIRTRSTPDCPERCAKWHKNPK